MRALTASKMLCSPYCFLNVEWKKKTFYHLCQPNKTHLWVTLACQPLMHDLCFRESSQITMCLLTSSFPGKWSSIMEWKDHWPETPSTWILFPVLLLISLSSFVHEISNIWPAQYYISLTCNVTVLSWFRLILKRVLCTRPLESRIILNCRGKSWSPERKCHMYSKW